MKNLLRLVSRKSLKNIVVSFILLTLASVIVIAVVVSGRRRKTLREGVEHQERADWALADSLEIGMEDFYLKSQGIEDGIVYPLRQQRRFWSREMVDSYWIDPTEAGLETLTEDNDMLILESLAVPEDGQP